MSHSTTRRLPGRRASSGTLNHLLRTSSLLIAVAAAGGCSTPSPGDAPASGGATGSGGSFGTGGHLGIGGGAPTGGTSASGGAASGSGATAGSGGVESGVGGAGAAGSGGSAGGAGGGAASGGASGGSTFEPVFILGADVSTAQERNPDYVDTDGQTKSIFELLKNHGFNYIRLRTFVDPSAPGGYASTAGDCDGKTESYGDKDHVIAYGKQAKDHGMGFLLDFHYSDVWADPGNQIIPASWRDATTTEELADLLSTYTKDVLEDAILAGARPDMVQVGNEITPGTVAHLPGSSTDCWGNNPGSVSAIGGINSSAAAWDRLAVLLHAGIDAVREVDPTI